MKILGVHWVTTVCNRNRRRADAIPTPCANFEQGIEALNRWSYVILLVGLLRDEHAGDVDDAGGKVGKAKLPVLKSQLPVVDELGFPPFLVTVFQGRSHRFGAALC